MKRVISIISVIFLLSVTMLPSWGYSYFVTPDNVYAQSEDSSLSDSDKVNAGLSVYLNSRGGWVTGQVDGVKAVMQGMLNTFYNIYVGAIQTNHQLAQNITVMNNPFSVRITAEGINFYNALFNYLKSNGYFDDLYSNNQYNSDTDTASDVYDGYMAGGGLFYIFDNTVSIHDWVDPSHVLAYGNPVDGKTSSYLKNLYNDYSETNSNFDYSSNSSQSSNRVTYTCNYASDLAVTCRMKANANYGTTNFAPPENGPYLLADQRTSGSGVNPEGIIYSSRVNTIHGFNAWFVLRGDASNVFHAGYIMYDSSNGKYSCGGTVTYNRNDISDLSDQEINFDTHNFDKNDVTPPSSDGINNGKYEYTPTDSSSSGGNTYNTYNDYFTDYVDKRTYVNNPSSGGSGGGSGGGGSDEGGSGEGGSGNGGSDGIASGYGTITPDGNGGFHFSLPDVGIPNFDGFNWSISGLTEKFPFSIPFDLIAFFTVLNAEPETPELQATIPLGRWEWSIDWDLHNFDNIAALLRNLEFIGFCIALILITRSIIKG